MFCFSNSHVNLEKKKSISFPKEAASRYSVHWCLLRWQLHHLEVSELPTWIRWLPWEYREPTWTHRWEKGLVTFVGTGTSRSNSPVTLELSSLVRPCQQTSWSSCSPWTPSKHVHTLLVPVLSKFKSPSSEKSHAVVPLAGWIHWQLGWTSILEWKPTPPIRRLKKPWKECERHSRSFLQQSNQEVSAQYLGLGDFIDLFSLKDSSFFATVPFNSVSVQAKRTTSANIPAHARTRGAGAPVLAPDTGEDTSEWLAELCIQRCYVTSHYKAEKCCSKSQIKCAIWEIEKL